MLVLKDGIGVGPDDGRNDVGPTDNAEGIFDVGMVDGSTEGTQSGNEEGSADDNTGDVEELGKSLGKTLGNAEEDGGKVVKDEEGRGELDTGESEGASEGESDE